MFQRFRQAEDAGELGRRFNRAGTAEMLQPLHPVPSSQLLTCTLCSYIIIIILITPQSPAHVLSDYPHQLYPICWHLGFFCWPRASLPEYPCCQHQPHPHLQR